MTHNKFSGPVEGINDLQAEYEKKYGPGDYVPPVAVTYWTFRLMVGAGTLMLFLILFALYKSMKDDYNYNPFLLKIFFWSLFLPHIAIATGWIFTEMGRQPWIVFGLMQTKDAVSNTVPAGNVLFSLIAYSLLYAVLMVATVFLWKKYAKLGIIDEEHGNDDVEPIISKA